LAPFTINTNPAEFKHFHERILKNAPRGYTPYYFSLKIGGKDPLEGISWKKNRKTFAEAYYLMKRGFNIGIAATSSDPLVIVDVDDMEQVPEVKPTLQVTSRKRIGRHNYFFGFDGSAKKNIATKDAGEVRSVWQYVVAPGSFVQCSEQEMDRIPENEKVNAGKYTLKNELPVSEITFEELPEVYKIRYSEIVHDEVELAIRHAKRKHTGQRQAGKHRSALWDLDITEVSGVRDTGGRRVPIPSEIHGSETGHNCSVSNGLLHCWRHDVTHNAFSYIAMLAGVKTCERAGLPHGGHYFGADAQDGETLFKVWMYAKENRLIPENDPIPSAALAYYALDKGMCKKSDLINEYGLPELIYHVALLVSKQEGLNFGRN
jgi:Bifunctional DNA primase/polymerase, N-terminal.